MTLYGVGLGPGEADLVTVRGKEVLEERDVVYSPGRLSRTVAAEPRRRVEDRRSRFPDDERRREASNGVKAAAAERSPRTLATATSPS